jgi:hypothetical protein
LISAHAKCSGKASDLYHLEVCLVTNLAVSNVFILPFGIVEKLFEFETSILVLTLNIWQ